MRAVEFRSGRAVTLVLGLFAAAPRAGAAVSGPDAHAAMLDSPAAAATFRADHLELDPALSRLTLLGHVVVAFDRYRLRGDSLELVRTKNGAVVTGSGRLAWCPCPDPPMTFGFSTAVFDEPGDLKLRSPTVYLGGVPVLWLPYLWLRSPDRVGMLPLIVAWRGSDGLLLGSGLHLPIDEAAFDVSAAGYVDGGVMLDARLTTPRTASVVRWDYVRETALTLDLRGAEAVPDSGAIAWSVDALRGARALRSPALLEEVALRDDRARAMAGWSGGGAVLGIEAFADAARGGPVASDIYAGPGAHAGWGGGLGDFGAADFDAGVATIQGEGATMTSLSQHSEIRADARAGVVAVSAEARARLLETLDEMATGHAVSAGGGFEASVPFVKELGARSAWQHWVTPFVTVNGGVADTRLPSTIPAIATNGVFFSGSAGLRTTLGEVAGARGAIGASARFGYLGERGAAARPAAAWTASARSRWFAVRGEGLALTRGSESGVALVDVIVGAEDGLFVEGRAAGGYGEVPPFGRFFVEGWDAPSRGWLFPEEGWSVGGRLGVPWTRWLRSVADADYDLRSHTLLGIRGTLGYRHPCGCFGVTLWGGHRAGRSGVDSFVAMELTP